MKIGRSFSYYAGIGFAGAIVGFIFAYTLHNYGVIDSAATLAGLAILWIILLISLWLAFTAIFSRLTGSDRKRMGNEAFWPIVAFAILPILYVPYMYYQTEGDESVLKPLSPFWQLFIVLILSLGLSLALLCLKFPVLQKGPLQALRRHPVATLAVIVSIWIAGASTMDILKTYYLNEAGNNTPIFTDILLNINSPQGPLYSEMFLSNGASLLALHSSFIWYLVYPVFMIWPTEYWLLIISNAALGLTAIPIFLLSRKFFGPGLSILLVLIFLMNRLVFAQPTAGDLSEERFLPVLLIAAFYFWQSNRYLPYLGFAFLALTVREDVGMVLILWGIYSLATRRSIKWSLTPVLMGGIWLAGTFFWLLPHMNASGSSSGRAVIAYGDLGHTSGEIASNLFLHPWVAVKQAFSSLRHLATWYGLIQSFGFGIPLLSGAAVLALPALAETFLISRPGLNIFNMLAVAAALFPAMVLGLARADRISLKRVGFRVAPALILVTLFSTMALSYTWLNPGWYAPRYNYETAISLLNAVPDDASVILPDYLLARAKPEQQVRGYYQVPYEVDETGSLFIEQDYVILDTFLPKSWQGSRYDEGLQTLTKELDAEPALTKAIDQGDLKLYVRTASPQTQ